MLIFACVVRTKWHCSFFDLLLTNKITFEAIAAVHRLSSAYRIPELQRKALILLSSAYPTTLAEFCDISSSDCRDQTLRVIQFAREYSIHWILPLAFYRFCLEMTPQTLFHGVDSVVLSVEDQGLCYEAEKLMVSSHLDNLLARHAIANRVDVFGCTGGDACRESRVIEADALLHTSLTSLPDIVSPWAPEPRSNLCQSCLEDMHRRHMQWRQAFWDDLPGVFELPEWGVLNEMKETALREPRGDEDVFPFSALSSV